MPKSFEELWNGVEELELPAADRERCIFARKFFDWSRDLCESSTEAGSLVSINQAKILLIDKYFEWRNVAPKAHRNRLNSVGHICIFEVFEQAYITLRALELALTPPMLFIPPPPEPPPPPPPAPVIAGIFLGEKTS